MDSTNQPDVYITLTLLSLCESIDCSVSMRRCSFRQGWVDIMKKAQTGIIWRSKCKFSEKICVCVRVCVEVITYMAAFDKVLTVLEEKDQSGGLHPCD